MAGLKVISAQDAAKELSAARHSRQAIRSFSQRGFHLDNSWAEEVKEIGRLERIAHGERIVGAKLGLTSSAKQKTMKVDRPVFGYLTDVMEMSRDINLANFIQPRIEPELVFRTSKDIDHELGIDEVGEYVEAITVGAEIIDSRYLDFQFSFEDVVADNTSAGGFVLGKWQETGSVNLGTASGSISKNGRLIHDAQLSQILGNPWLALIALSRHLGERGELLPKGSIVLAGSMTDAVPMTKNDWFEVGIAEADLLRVTTK